MATLQDIAASQYFLHGVDEDSYKQGRYLAAERRVVLKHDDEEKAVAEVYDGEDKYEVELWNNDDRLEASCGCTAGQAGQFCAHAVAAALSI
jgi:uncharacterized Zn finger protein